MGPTSIRVHLVLAGGGGVEAEDAELAGGRADGGQGFFELFGVFGFDIDIELVFEGLAVDGAALDFQQIHAMSCERFEGSQQCAGTVREAQGE